MTIQAVFRPAFACLAMAAATAVCAQQPDNEATPITAVKVAAQGLPGTQLPVTVDSGTRASRWCGLVLDFGDGEQRQIKIGYDVQFPVTVTKSYERPGTYTVKAFGRKITTHPPCDGTATAQLQVSAPAPVRAATPATVATNCPATINVRNAAGTEVAFGLRQLVVDSGGIQKAREQVAQRLLDTQGRALDDTLPSAERENAKQFAGSLRLIREALGKCE